jgi:hypothetical protein
LAVKQVGINARHLRRAVGAHAQSAPGELVHELEGLQVQSLVAAAQQRLQVLHKRRHYQLVAVASGHIEQPAPNLLNMPCL